MSNHFPSASDNEFQVVSVLYQAVIGQGATAPSAAGGVFFGWTADTDNLFSAVIFELQYQFPAAYAGRDGEGNPTGALSVDYGSFDQDAVEALITSALNELGSALGITWADGSPPLVVNRTWGFQVISMPSVASTNQPISGQDAMPYTQSS
jgi:hypothetical protein